MDQQKKYEKELGQDKKKIEELEQWKKKAEEQKNKEVVKFQDQIDALEDKEYKKTLDDTKDTIAQEREQIQKEEKKKKTMEYVNSFGQADVEKDTVASNMSNADFDDTDRIIQENIKTVGEIENANSLNDNDKLYNDNIQS